MIVPQIHAIPSYLTTEGEHLMSVVHVLIGFRVLLCNFLKSLNRYRLVGKGWNLLYSDFERNISNMN